MVDHHASFTPRMMSLKTLALGPKSIWPFDINVVSEILVSGEAIVEEGKIKILEATHRSTLETNQALFFFNKLKITSINKCNNIILTN